MTTHYDYLRDILAAAEEVGAFVVSFAPSERSGLFVVVLDFGDYLRVSVEDINPAGAIRKLAVLREGRR